MAPATKPTIVLVHGAWHSVDCFDLLRGELHKRGWPTEAPAHPSPGADSGTAVGTAENAAAIRKVLQRLCDEGKEIVVVAHSYGGATSSCAVEGLASKKRAAAGKHGGVLLLVYLTAFVIPKGCQGSFVHTVTPEDVFYHDVPPSMGKKFIGLLRPEPLKIFEDKITYEPWHDIECAYICCDDDRAIPLLVQEEMAACAKSEYNCAVLDHVGLSNGGTSHDLAERIFTAILCLIPQLRTLAFPPPPGKAWCRGYVKDFDEDVSNHTNRCTYNTLSSLLGRVCHDARLSSATLQNLDAVRLTVIPRTDSWNAKARPYYTFQIDACLSILQAPSLKELETDMDTATRGIGLHSQVPLANLKIQRAFLTSAAFDQEMLEYVCEH
ncbi:hypothetical protein AUP68_08163 [Ilyonectria robusta]